MDRQMENKCLKLVENYRILAAGNKMEFTEMLLACAGIYLAAGREPDMDRVKECKKTAEKQSGDLLQFPRFGRAARTLQDGTGPGSCALF